MPSYHKPAQSKYFDGPLYQMMSEDLQLTQHLDPLKKAVAETSEDVWDSLKLVGDEIREGFKRIRKSL